MICSTILFPSGVNICAASSRWQCYKVARKIKKGINRPKKMFPCGHCDQQFPRKYQLNSHLYDAHADIFPSNPADFGCAEGEACAGRPIIDDSTIPIVPENMPSKLKEAYTANWMDLRTKTHLGPVQDIYRIRTTTANTETLKPYLQWIFNQQKTRFLINVSYGYILRHIETNEYSFYWPSAENNRVLEYCSASAEPSIHSK